MTLRIGIAGFGNHALGRMLPVIDANEGLSLVAAWTGSETRQALLRERGCTGIAADFSQFLDLPMDVVYVASPTGLHYAHTAAILAAGHHAWVEKPLATSLDEVRTLVARAEAGQRMLTETFMFPWHAQAAVIRQALAENRIGALRSVALTFCIPHLAPHDFRYKPELGGGAFLDHACYLVKALDSYLGGEWTVLGGCLDHAQHAVDVAGAALLRREADGVVASLDWGFGRSYINEIRIVGERGRMLVESAFTKPTSRACDIIVEDGQGRQSMLPVTREDPYARMFEGFVQQYATPACWHAIRQDLVGHAERYFTLQSALQQFR